MDKFKMLSGDQLVAHGAKKANVSLPEIGIKEVFPNGSWLEQKQIQNALEARKHLVEMERIEKLGVLSLALWREDLKLAEVTQKCGSHWQYLGHTVGKQWYIFPEETLLLMEMNSLQLKHHGVVVSIQKAYSLLLNDTASLVRYKVYASLSKLGYKVFRHDKSRTYNNVNMEVDAISKDLNSELESELTEIPESTDGSIKTANISGIETEVSRSMVHNNGNMEVDTISKDFNSRAESAVTNIPESVEGTIKIANISCTETEVSPSMVNNNVNMEIVTILKDLNSELESEVTDIRESSDGYAKTSNISSTETEVSLSIEDKQNTATGLVREDKYELNGNKTDTMVIDKTNEGTEVISSVNLCHESNEKTSVDSKARKTNLHSKGSIDYIQSRLELLCSREKPCRLHVVHQSFKENLPDLFQKQLVTVKAPQEKYIPRNVFLNNTVYVLNLGNLRLKNVHPTPSSSSQTYSSSDDVNERHVRRIRGSFSNESAQTNWMPQFFPNMRFPQETNQYRQFNYWSHYTFNMQFQRPFFPSMPLRFHVFPRMQPMFRCYNSLPNFTPNSNDTEPGRPQKRKREGTKKYHLDSIKKLAVKLKSLVQSGNRQEENIHALQRLINTYNIRYKAKLQLSNSLEIAENEIILETIELEDDDHCSHKKKRKSDENESFEHNLNALKKIALKIKAHEDKNEASPRHKRALSNAIKTFNKSYDADIYVNSNYEVVNRREIVITSSSDSECVVETTPKPKKTKKLRNPFSILKHLSEKQTATSEQNARQEPSVNSESISRRNFKYNEFLKNTFDNDWLPGEDDFGRAEVIPRGHINSRLRDHREDFLYEFIRGNLCNNWLDAKIAYWQSCKESAIKFEANSQNQSNFKLNSIINPEDCTDLKSVLKKLGIIKTNKEVKDECSLNIDFDVYNRDVQNFKKTSKPKPHFRIICIEESAGFPSGIELATLQSRYMDDVSVVFAVVGNSSISYLQVNPTDLPIYIPPGNLP